MYLQLRTNKNPQNDDACSINQFATVTWYQLVPMWSKPWPHIATNSLPMSHAQLGGDSQTKTLRKLSDRMTCTYGSHCRTLRRWIAEVCSMRPVEMSILWRSSCVNILSFQLNKKCKLRRAVYVVPSQERLVHTSTDPKSFCKTPGNACSEDLETVSPWHQDTNYLHSWSTLRVELVTMLWGMLVSTAVLRCMVPTND